MGTKLLKRRFVSAFLSFAVVATTMLTGIGGLTASAASIAVLGDLQAALNSTITDGGGTVTMTNDITGGVGETNISIAIPSSTTIILDGGGYTLNAADGGIALTVTGAGMLILKNISLVSSTTIKPSECTALFADSHFTGTVAAVGTVNASAGVGTATSIGASCVAVANYGSGILNVTSATSYFANQGCGVANYGSGTVNVTNAMSDSIDQGFGVANSGSGTINVTNATGKNSLNNTGVINGGSGTVNVTNAIGGGGTSCYESYGVRNGTGTVNVTNATGGSAQISHGVENNNGIVNVASATCGSAQNGGESFSVFNYSGTVNAGVLSGNTSGSFNTNAVKTVTLHPGSGNTCVLSSITVANSGSTNVGTLPSMMDGYGNMGIWYTDASFSSPAGTTIENTVTDLYGSFAISDLQAALNSSINNGGGTVTMTNDITGGVGETNVGITVPSGTTIVLDGGGHALNAVDGGSDNSCALTVSGAGTLILKDITLAGGTSTNASYGLYTDNQFTGTIVTSGTVTAIGGDHSQNSYGVINYGSGTVIVTTAAGGSAPSSDGVANLGSGTIYVTTATGGSATNSYGVFNDQNGTVNVTTATGGTLNVENTHSGTVNTGVAAHTITLHPGNGNAYVLSSITIASSGNTTLGTLPSAADTNGNLGVWYTDSSFSSPAGTTLDSSVTDLYAKFTYTVTLDANGGTGSQTPETFTGGVANSLPLLNALSFSRPGYTFLGWSTDKNAAQAAYSDGASYTATGNVTLYAIWASVSNAISYNLNGGTNDSSNPASYTYGTGVSSFADPTQTGYTFGGWYSDTNFTTKVISISTTQAGAFTLNAKWTPAVYPITYHLYDCNNNQDNPTSYTFGTEPTLKDPSKMDYTFGGWYTDSGFAANAKITAISATQTGSVILYAKWTQNSSGGGGSYSPPAPVDTTITGTSITTTTGSTPTTTTTAQIPISDTNPSTIANVNVNLGSVTVTAPASVLSGALGGDNTSTLALSQSNSPLDTQSQIQIIGNADGLAPVLSLDINLTRTSANGTTTQVHQLNGSITITIKLTDGQIAEIAKLGGAHLYYYDPVTKTLTDMNATFDLTNGTATFRTNHCSTYVIAGADKTPPTVTGVENNDAYNTGRTIIFDKGTANLDGAAFASGSTVSSEGKHTLVVTDAAGYSTTVVFAIDKTAPVVSGVSNANETITFDTGTATLDGAAFTSGSTVSSEGKHTLVVTDAAGNSTTVVFVIDKSLPVIKLTVGKTPIKNGAISSSNVTVSVSDLFDVTASVTFNGNVTAWPASSAFAKDGKYLISVKDQYGYTSKTTFTIDKTAPKITVKSVSGGKTVSISETNLSAKTVTLNGKKLAWPGDNKFTKKGAYVITVTDKAGHKATSKFSI